MTEWVVLSRTEHAHTHYLPRSGFKQASGNLVVPISLTELPKLLTQYMLGFVAAGEGFQAVALLGLERGKNLYVNHDGLWLGVYTPARFREYPFTLAKNQQGGLVLCIDAECLLKSGDGGAPLFDEEGQPSEEVSEFLNFLNQCEQDRQRTQAAVDALQKAGCIQPWELSISRGEGEDAAKIGGLYRVDEKALNSLSAEDYLHLQGAPMALAHAHLFSMHQHKQLTERYVYHAKQNTQELPEDLDKFFDDGDDDDLTFSFD